MAFITNGGSKLIGRALNEGKSIVFGSVRMNTIYESNPSELVQKPDNWYGANIGQVVGCLSHVSVDGVSCVCDSKLAIQCDDNSKSWKSVGVYAHIEGESGEILLACESIQNGDYKNVTIVELPVTLDGVVDDFGIQGGGGGDIPANMMTTDTYQQVFGVKTWWLDAYEGEGTEDVPKDGDRKFHTSLSLGEAVQDPIAIETQEQYYTDKDGWMDRGPNLLQLSSSGVTLNYSTTASWGQIINAARNEQGFDRVVVTESGGLVFIGDNQVNPNSDIKIEPYVMLVIDSNGDIESIYATGGNVLDVSAAVYDNGSVHRVNGIISDDGGLSFESPITPGEGQVIFIHWSHYVD